MVLIVGAGPSGLVLACMLQQEGIPCRVVDNRRNSPPRARSVGVSPRTLEVLRDVGVVERVIGAGLCLKGQFIFFERCPIDFLDLTAQDSRYGWISLPQGELESLLARELLRLGGVVERGVQAVVRHAGPGGVIVSLRRGTVDETSWFDYVAGCDGAQSAVRDAVGLRVEGGRLDGVYWGAEVELDWQMPAAHNVRCVAGAPAGAVEALACWPLPANGHYRLVASAPRLSPAAPSASQLQWVFDRLAPIRTRVRAMGWSSAFSLSHHLVDRYSVGNVFLCGDAAHLSTPRGAQGSNAGMQDAHNLAWKITLVAAGVATPRLLDSYEIERRPVGREAVESSLATPLRPVEPGLRESERRRRDQLSVRYGDSPIVGEQPRVPTHLAAGPPPGALLPKVDGLRRADGSPAVIDDLRYGADHLLLLYADSSAASDGGFAGLVAAVRKAHHGRLRIACVLHPNARLRPPAGVPVFLDANGEYGAKFGGGPTHAYLVRPDRHIGYRTWPAQTQPLVSYARKIFRPT